MAVVADHGLWNVDLHPCLGPVPGHQEAVERSQHSRQGKAVLFLLVGRKVSQNEKPLAVNTIKKDI